MCECVCVLYPYNVLHAFLHDGCTQRRGHTDNCEEGLVWRTDGFGLRTVSLRAVKTPGADSSCSGFSSPHGGPCPEQSGGIALRLTACFVAHQPVGTLTSRSYSHLFNTLSFMQPNSNYFSTSI